MSPDYASTRKSSETQESVERPRAGVLRTVGDASAPPPEQTDDSEYAVPDIHFGRSVIPARTQSPMRAPTPAGIAATGNDARAYSPAPRSFSPGPRAFSPGPGGRKSPGPGPATGGTHLREESDDTTRRVAWQPGAVKVGSPSGDRALSPEQFVQMRAAAAQATPLYAHGHQRSVSSNTLTALRTGTPTPPLRRNGSQELLSATLGGSAPHSRSSSADLLQQRPSSQGTGAVFSGTGDMSSHLSAREQEHVARVTGTPLINVNRGGGGGGGPQGPQPQAPGLVGAIEAREREKAHMKHGLGGQAVAAAIDQRQREQYNQAQRAAQIAYANQMAGQQQQQNFGRPGAMSPGPGPSMYPGSSMGPLGMGMGPGPVVMSPPRNNSFGPGMPPPQQQQQQRPPQMMPQQLSYGQPSPQMYGPPSGGPWGGPPQQQRGPPQSPMQPPPHVGMGMRGGPGGSRPQSPAIPPPRQQFSPVGQPGGPRPGTPGGGMAFQGQAF